MRDAELTTEAAGLAERILDEIGKLDHDWEEVAIWAHELAELGEVGATLGAQPRPSGQQPHVTGPPTTPHRVFAASEARERERLAASLAALAHPTRLLILQALSPGHALSPTEVAELEPSTSLPAVAYHARELRSCGLITRAGTRRARGSVQHFYTLSPRGRGLLELVEQLSRGSAAP